MAGPKSPDRPCHLHSDGLMVYGAALERPSGSMALNLVVYLCHVDIGAGLPEAEVQHFMIWAPASPPWHRKASIFVCWPNHRRFFVSLTLTVEGCNLLPSFSHASFYYFIIILLHTHRQACCFVS